MGRKRKRPRLRFTRRDLGIVSRPPSSMRRIRRGTMLRCGTYEYLCHDKLCPFAERYAADRPNPGRRCIVLSSLGSHAARVFHTLHAGTSSPAATALRSVGSTDNAIKNPVEKGMTRHRPRPEGRSLYLRRRMLMPGVPSTIWAHSHRLSAEAQPVIHDSHVRPGEPARDRRYGGLFQGTQPNPALEAGRVAPRYSSLDMRSAS